MDWQQNMRLSEPAAVSDATKQYRGEMDVLGQWIEERCCLDNACRGGATTLYRNYKAWVEERGEEALSQTAFGSRLVTKEFVKGRDARNCVVYEGIDLRLGGSA
jgi:putative DNA primase/helicase